MSFFSLHNYQKELARSQRKLQFCLDAYSEQLLQLVCKPYENNIRPVTPDSQGNIQPRKSIPTDLEIIAANLSVKEQQQKIQNWTAKVLKKPIGSFGCNTENTYY